MFPCCCSQLFKCSSFGVISKCTISKQEKMVIEAFQINLAFVLASQQQYFNQALFLRQKVIIINFLSSFAQARNL